MWDRSVHTELAHRLVFYDKAGGGEEEAMELGETGYRIEIAANRNNPGNSENFKQMFSKETMLSILSCTTLPMTLPWASLGRGTA